MVINEELKMTIIDYHPILILPDTSFLDVIKKLVMGHNYLIVVDNLIPLGFISERIILKIIDSNINIYSLRAKNFCESFPSEKETNLPDLFTLAQNIYTEKYQVYGCLNNQNNLIGIITAKSLCNYIQKEVFYQQVSILEVTKPNLMVVSSNYSLLTTIKKLSLNPNLEGFVCEVNSELKVFSFQAIIKKLIESNWKNKTLNELDNENLPIVINQEKISVVNTYLENHSGVLIKNDSVPIINNHILVNSSLNVLNNNKQNHPLKVTNQINLVTSKYLIKVLTPLWQNEYLKHQQQEIQRIKTAFKFEKKQVEQEKLLSGLSSRIRKSLNLNEILNNTVNEVRDFLDCDRVIVYQLYPDGDGVIIAESVTQGVMSILGRVVQDHCFAKDFIKPYLNGRIQAVDNVFTANLSPCHLNLLLGIQIQANLVVPIIFHDQLWGLLATQNCLQPRHWHEDELDLLQQLGTQVAIAIQQSEYAQRALEVAKYQTAIAKLGNTALISHNLDTLMNTTVKIVSKTLNVKFCDILQLNLNKASFILKSGVGWDAESELMRLAS